MATNVSEKDKTLNEIIDWCENQRRKIGYVKSLVETET